MAHIGCHEVHCSIIVVIFIYCIIIPAIVPNVLLLVHMHTRFSLAAVFMILMLRSC